MSILIYSRHIAPKVFTEQPIIFSLPDLPSVSSVPRQSAKRGESPPGRRVEEGDYVIMIRKIRVKM
jgi:hypothetical protein